MLKPEQATTLERKIGRFSDILDKRPGDELTVLALAEASFRRGLKLEALTAYQMVTSVGPVPEAHLAVAEIYSQQDMSTEAYGELRQLFELDPENVEARLLAHELLARSPAPADIADILNRPTSEEAFAEAELRLRIQKAIHNRELQERTRNQTLEPGEVIHEYYVEEAKKKLLDVDEQLKNLEELKQRNSTLSLIPRAEVIPAQEVAPAEFPSEEVLSPEHQALENNEIAPEVEPASDTSISTVTSADNISVEDVSRDDSNEPMSGSASVPETGPGPYAAAEVVTETPAAEVVTETRAAEVVTETPAAEVVTETRAAEVVTETPAAEVVTETPAAEVVAETPVAEVVTETPVAEVVAETPVAEVVTETPAAEVVTRTDLAPDSDNMIELQSPDESVSEFEVPNLEEVPRFDEHPESSEIVTKDSPSGESQSQEFGSIGDLPVPDFEYSDGGGADETLSQPNEMASAGPPANEPFAIDIDLGVENLVAPDLPEIPDVTEQPDVMELPPIQLRGEDMPMPTIDLVDRSRRLDGDLAPPAIDPLPTAIEIPIEQLTVEPEVSGVQIGEPIAPIEVAPAPVAPTANEVEIDLSSHSVSEDSMVVEAAVQDEAVLPVETVVPVAASAEVEAPVLAEVPAAADPAARRAFYESKAEELGKLTGTLARTRGVTSIFLVARDGTTIDSVIKDEITEERVGELVRESFDFLLAYAKSPAYWVLECGGGIFVMQTLDDDHVLIAIGQAGANFGALRYTMDKTKTKFGAILQDVPG